LEMHGQVGRLCGERSTEAWSMANMLATSAHNENRFDEALSLYSETLEIREELLGKEHGSLIEPHANRAIAYFAAGRLEEAFDDAKEAARLSEQIFGLASLEAVLSYNNVLYIGAKLGRFEDAERFGLVAYEHAHGTRLPRTHVARNLATLYTAWDEAEPGKGHGETAARFLAEAEEPGATEPGAP